MKVVKIVIRTPFRISLTGGTDLLPYVKKYGGDAFGATIDKYVTVSLTKRNDSKINLTYPDGEEKVDLISEIKNPIIRQALISHNFKDGLDLISVSDIPPGSGLGSSGAFTVGLLNALHHLKGIKKSAKELAEEAADLEINQLKAPIGKQDQYMSAFGGFVHLEFQKNNDVRVNKLRVDEIIKKRFEKEFLLVYSGIKRSASKVLSVTAKRFTNTEAIFSDITAFREYGNQMRDLILAGKVNEFAGKLKNLLTLKKKCYVACTNEKMEKFIEAGYKAGATGAKIIGAGGGGFVYFYVPKEKQENFKAGIILAGGKVFPYSFVEQGSYLA